VCASCGSVLGDRIVDTRSECAYLAHGGSNDELTIRACMSAMNDRELY